MHKLEVIDLLKSPILNSYAPRSTKDIKDPPIKDPCRITSIQGSSAHKRLGFRDAPYHLLGADFGQSIFPIRYIRVKLHQDRFSLLAVKR